MNVTLIQETEHPVETISKIASICYGSNPESPEALVKKLYLSGHHSVFEHIYYTFLIEGISRACSHQLVRHRMCAFTQRSQRYCSERNAEYVYPRAITGNDYAEDQFDDAIDAAEAAYNRITLNGVKNEDARYVLPNACCTSLYLSCNLRELMHIANERLCCRAQWEIRDVVKSMAGFVDQSLQYMMVPKCRSGLYICNEKCAMKEKKNEQKNDA